MRNLTTNQKLWGMMIVAWISMLLLAAWGGWGTRSVMYKERHAMAEKQMEIVVGLLDSVTARVQRGELSQEAGKQRAIELIASLRYDSGRGYFFVFDGEYNNVSHPTIASGAVVRDYKDVDGRSLFVEMLEGAKRKGEAIVDYRWKHAGTGEAEPKSSYIRHFADWDWYIGTGVYISDINKAFLSELFSMLLGLGVVGTLFTLMMGWVSRDLSRSLGGDPHYAAEVVRKIAAGDLSQRPRLRAGDQQSLLFAIDRMCEQLSHTVGDIQRSSDEVNTAAMAISAGNTELASRTEQQAAALAETASTMEELTSTVRQNAENAEQARQLAANCAGNARQGGGSMEQVVASMSAIQNSAGQMASIVDTIDSIAFQTNILALNASVEAARAGEQGRGFAVVAGEVRKLASRSAEAAHEIKGLIDGAGQQVKAGSQLVRETGDIIRGVVADMASLNTLISEISSASNEQSNGIEQINVAVAEMDQMTQQNAGLVQQSALSSQRLSRQSEQLREHVAHFGVADTQGGRPAGGAQRSADAYARDTAAAFN